MIQHKIYCRSVFFVLISSSLLHCFSWQCTAVDISVSAESAIQVQSSSSVSSFAILTCNIGPANASIKSRWITPHGRIISKETESDRYTLTEGRTPTGLGTILAVHSISYEDAGVYTCEAVSRGATCNRFPVSSSIQLVLQVRLQCPEREVTVREGTMATLRCEMSGYILPNEDLQWYKGHDIIYDQTENRFSITFEEGAPNSAQNGGIRPVASRISLLTISSSVLSDAGDYVCRVRGSDVSAVVTLSVEEDYTGTTTVGDAVVSTDISTTALLQETHSHPTKITTQTINTSQMNGELLIEQRRKAVTIALNGCEDERSKIVAMTFGITFSLTVLLSVLLTTAAFCLWLKLWQCKTRSGPTDSEYMKEKAVDAVKVQVGDSVQVESSGTLE